MVGVTLKKNQSIDSALRYFKKKVLINGVIKDIKRTLYFEKPSVKKKVVQAIMTNPNPHKLSTTVTFLRTRLISHPIVIIKITAAKLRLNIKIRCSMFISPPALNL